ncbi:hypothetical protein AB0J38_11655 [Streptomyces sp. NPDC050095]|uniref:hypothetical protein n=1 Tax=unclassified Streptomyces TaxID=2593676 RepID=UPI00341DB5F0
MTTTLSLAEQARAAAEFVAHTRATDPRGPYRGEDHALTILRVSALLGLERTHITAGPDGLRRHHQIGEPVRATATCPATGEEFVFLNPNPNYTDEPLHLIRPCPFCGGDVPLIQVITLADLGTYLTEQPDPVRLRHVLHLLSDLFDEDPGHLTGCTRHASA